MFDKIGENIGSAVKKENLMNTGLFAAIGAVVGGLVGGFDLMPMLLGAGAGFLTTGLTGFKILGRGDAQADAPAGAGANPQGPQIGRQQEMTAGMPGSFNPNQGLPRGQGQQGQGQGQGQNQRV